MAKNKSPFRGRKKFNRAVMNSDMDGKGDKAVMFKVVQQMLVKKK